MEPVEEPRSLYILKYQYDFPVCWIICILYLMLKLNYILYLKFPCYKWKILSCWYYKFEYNAVDYCATTLCSKREQFLRYENCTECTVLRDCIITISRLRFNHKLTPSYLFTICLFSSPNCKRVHTDADINNFILILKKLIFFFGIMLVLILKFGFLDVLFSLLRFLHTTKNKV